MTTYTDEELQAIVEGARAREGWYTDSERVQIRDKSMGFVLDCYEVDDMHFLIDTIRALPVLYDKWQEEREKNRRLQIFLDEAEQFMVNDSNQAKILEQLKEQTELVRKVVINDTNS